MTEDQSEPSVLGKKEYWESFYQNDLENYDGFGDAGEIWFGRRCQDRIVKWLTQHKNADRERLSIIDLGCGNGSLLLALRNGGFQQLTGVDYAASAVQLAVKQCKTDNGTEIQLLVVDILDGLDSATDVSGTVVRLDGRFDVVIDKGTYDAVCLQKDRLAKVKTSYKNSLLRLLKENGDHLFIIASCNSTKDELIEQFSPELRVIDEILAPSTMTFGGCTGTTVTTLVFGMLK